MDNTDSILEVGLGFTCDFDKPGGTQTHTHTHTRTHTQHTHTHTHTGFIGQEAVLLEKKAGMGALKQRLASLQVLDLEVCVCWGGGGGGGGGVCFGFFF